MDSAINIHRNFSILTAKTLKKDSPKSAAISGKIQHAALKNPNPIEAPKNFRSLFFINCYN